MITPDVRSAPGASKFRASGLRHYRICICNFACLLVGVLAASAPAHAYESQPEFHFFGDTEALSFDSPQDIDSEYSSHVLNYAKPLWWDKDSWFSNRVFDFSVGSVSSKEFALDHRVKLNVLLLDSLEFRFSQLMDRNLQDDHSTNVLELIHWRPSGFGFSVYGSLSRDKDQDDVGIAVLRKISDGEARAYATFADFQRNQRNHEPDRWVDGRAPMTLGYVARGIFLDDLGRKHYRESSWRWERQLHWLFPVEQRLYAYSRNSLQLTDLTEVTPGHRVGLRLAWDEKFESEGPTAATSMVSDKSMRRKRFSLRFENEEAVDGHFWRSGVNFEYRDFHSHGQTLIDRDYLPYLWWISHLRGNESFAQRWHVGYDTTLHWPQDAGHLLADSPKSYKSENRLNILWELRFGHKATMNWLFTFDLDRFGTGQTWEGGCGQFQLLF